MPPVSTISRQPAKPGPRAPAGALPSAAAGIDYLLLLKPRVMMLVVFTGFVGLYLAPGDLHPVREAIAVLCIAVGAGAAGAINMWYDRDIDAVMARTRGRPIPAGRMPPESALAFGVILSVGAVALMGLAANWAAAALLAATIGFYVFIYTAWLKRRTPQNIVIGGAAGAFPPVIGWLAVTGEITTAPVILFALIFLWTPPHFWALSLYRVDDYRRAGIPMLPVVSGRRETKWQMLAYTVLLAPVALAPWLLGYSGPLYGAAAGVLSLGFIVCAVRVLREAEGAGDGCAKSMFGFSIVYLFLVFLALVMDRMLGGVV